LGMLLVIFSYDGQISIGINSCEEMVPDPKQLAGYFEQSLAELEQSVAAPVKGERVPEQDAARQPESDEDDPMHEFREAERALDAAIESLQRGKDN